MQSILKKQINKKKKKCDSNEFYKRRCALSKCADGKIVWSLPEVLAKYSKRIIQEGWTGAGKLVTTKRATFVKNGQKALVTKFGFGAQKRDTIIKIASHALKKY